MSTIEARLATLRSQHAELRAMHEAGHPQAHKGLKRVVEELRSFGEKDVADAPTSHIEPPDLAARVVELERQVAEKDAELAELRKQRKQLDSAAAAK